MARKYNSIYVRVTDEQTLALSRALDKKEQRTSDHVIQADVIREWIGKFCQSEGERWPPFYKRWADKRSKRTSAKVNAQ